METRTYRFARPARRPAAFAMVGAGIGLVALFIFVIDAHPLIVAVAALAVAPAAYDLARGTTATLTLTDRDIAWASGTRAVTVPLAEIDQAVLATTLDFSQRATLLLRDGRRVRIPPECLPGGRILDSELDARGIGNRRSLFSF